jgi:hypothetical protein
MDNIKPIEYKVEKESNAAKMLPEYFYVGGVRHILVIVDKLNEETDCG